MSEADITLAEKEVKITTRTKEKTPWWGPEAAFLLARNTWGLILRDEDTNSFGAVFGAVPERLRRLPDQRVFTHPLVIVNDGFSRIAFVDFDILFQHSIGAVSGPKKDTDLLLFLTALLNSPLATLLSFSHLR